MVALHIFVSGRTDDNMNVSKSQIEKEKLDRVRYLRIADIGEIVGYNEGKKKLAFSVLM